VKFRKWIRNLGQIPASVHPAS